MPAGYQVNGTDLDDIFKAKFSGSSAATTNILVGGSDLNTRYEPIGSSEALSYNTNIKVNNTDLKQIFMDKSYPVVTISDQYLDIHSTGGSPVGYRLNSNGQAQSGVGNTWTDIPGEWLVNGSASACEVSFAIGTMSGSGAVVAQPGNQNTWYPLNQGDRVWLILANPGNSFSVTYTISIRRASTTTVLDVATITLFSYRS